MNIFIASLFVISIVCVLCEAQLTIEGYYWRDYEGILPGDALPGGLDKNGRPIYIGQVLFENKLIPGKIYENNKNIYFHWGPEQITDKNVKILCTQHPEKFEWVSTKANEVVLLTNKMLVKGGFEPEYFTYIGRIYAGEETTVGKVICGITNCLGLFITKDGKSEKHEGVFEILNYNSINKAASNISCNSLFILPN